MTDVVTDLLSVCLSDCLFDWLTEWVSEWLTDWSWLTDWLAYRLTDCSRIDRVTAWLTDFKIDWLPFKWPTEWVYDWLINDRVVGFLEDGLFRRKFIFVLSRNNVTSHHEKRLQKLDLQNDQISRPKNNTPKYSCNTVGGTVSLKKRQPQILHIYLNLFLSKRNNFETSMHTQASTRPPPFLPLPP